MDSKKVVLSGEFDATGVKQGTDQAKQAVRDLATDAAAQGAKAGAGLEKIGEGASKGARQADRELSNLAQSIQRATARIESAGQSQAQYFEALARQRGVSVDALQPYLAQLREVEARQGAANVALNQGAAAVQRVGLSAGQTRMALQQLPLQFQDIVVSLQAGQAPLTVLLQQGSQIAGSFGGVAAALKQVGGFLLGLITPVTVLGAAVATLGAGFALGRREIAETEKALILSGQAAGVTGSQIGLLADQLDRIGGTRGRATEVLREFAKAGELGAANLQRFAAAAIALERAGGPAAEETAKAFADLADKPLEASLKLARSTNFLTTAVLDQITALEQQGRTVEAARVAQEAYARTAEDQTPKLLENLGLVERAWRGIKTATSEAGDAILSIGRSQGLNEQIAALQQQLARNIELRRGEAIIPGLGSQNDGLRQQIAALQEVARLEARSAQLLAQQARQVQARGEFDKQGLQFLSQREKLERDILQARELGLRAGLTEEQIQKRIADIRARAAGAGPRGPTGNRELEQQLRLINELSGVTSGYTEDVQRLIAARDSGLVTDQRYLELLQALIARTPQAKAAEKEREDSLRAQAQAIEQATKARERELQTLDANLAAGEREIQQLQDQLLALTQGKDALEDRVQLRIEERIVALEAAAASALLERADAAEYERLRQLAGQLQTVLDLRRQIAGATADNAVKAANDKAAADAAAAWKRTSDQISQSLTDAIIQGGASGLELLERAAKALVLRPIIDAAVQPLAQSITGGLQGLLGSGSGRGGLLGTLGGAAGFAGSFGTFGSLFNAGAALTGTGISGTLGALSGAGSLIGQGQVLNGLGLGAGALGPYAAAALVIAQVAKSLDKSGTPSTGSVVTVDSQGARTGGSDPSRILSNFNQQTDAALRTLAGGAVGLLNGLAQSVGQAGDFVAQAKFTADNVDASFGDFVLNRGGRTVGDILGDQPDGARSFDRDPTRGFEQFAVDVAAITRQALADIDLPAFARRQIDALGADATLDQLTEVGQGIQATITAIGALRGALDPLAGSLGLLADQSSDSLFRLAELSGGFDALGANVQSFYGAFVSETDRAAAETERITGVLEKFGLTLPQTRDEFADLVQAQIALGEAGQPALAALLGVAGSFDTLKTRAEDLQRQLSDALIGAAERFAPDQVLTLRTDRIRLDLAEAGVQVDLQQLLGASADDIEAFARAFIAAGDASVEAQIAVLRAAGALVELRDSSAGTQAILQQRLSLEERLLRLQGDTAALRLRELEEALDPYNRALLEQVFALEDAQAALAKFGGAVKGFFADAERGSITLAGGGQVSGEEFFRVRREVTDRDLRSFIEQYPEGSLDRNRLESNFAVGSEIFLGALTNAVASAEIEYQRQLRIPAQLEAQNQARAGNRAGTSPAERAAEEARRAQEENTKALQRLTGSLTDYLESLNTSDLIGLSLEEQQRNAIALFQETADRARAGDVQALESIQSQAQRAIELTNSAFGRGAAGAGQVEAIVQAIRELQQITSRLVDVEEGGVQVTARGLAAVEGATRDGTAAATRRTDSERLAAQRLVGFEA